MGARIPPNQRPRRGAIKCEFCGRAVHSAAALLTHQASLHSQALKEKAKRKSVPTKISKVPKPEPRKVILKAKPKVVGKEGKKIDKKSPVAQTTIRVVRKQPIEAKSEMEKAANKDVAEISKSLHAEAKNNATAIKKNPNLIKVRKTEYKCPKCDKLFPVLFVAQKHIQKHHPVNSKNEKVSIGSADIIQPILLELCLYCDEKFTSPHHCPNRPQAGLALSYNCTGCHQRFKSSKLFDMHVADVHGDGSESMFFPVSSEFTTWKTHMETQTGCKYVIMGKYNSKEIYRCGELEDAITDDKAQFCPSTIITSVFPKGLQVNFYPGHHGHEHKYYQLTDQYKSYTITDLIEQAGCNIINMNSDDNDLYIQFKTLMESIVLDAAKINIDSLKILISKAMEMTNILTQYDEDDEMDSMETTSNRSTLSLNTSKKDDHIAKALRTIQIRKRGIEENGTGEKRARKSPADNKLLKPATKKASAFSLADNKDSVKEKPATKKASTFSLADDKDSVKVKPTIKKPSAFSLADDKDSVKILKELDKDNTKINKDKKVLQPPSFADTYKEFIDKTISASVKSTLKPSLQPSLKPSLKPTLKPSLKPTFVAKKKKVVKTKMGQFKPSLSPKKETRRDSLGKAKDIEYEIREQENDCNILVLKI